MQLAMSLRKPLNNAIGYEQQTDVGFLFLDQSFIIEKN